MALNYLLIGVQGTVLSADEKRWLALPQLAGVVLFSRNFETTDQLLALNASIREVCDGALICVDQEGGRVQRFGSPCSRLPPLGSLGRLYNSDRDAALELALAHASLMAREMLALDVDLSFAPVMDLDGCSSVIGDRALHSDQQVVTQLARAYLKGMRQAGMATCGKHFPGHGSVAEDTHYEMARDERSWDSIAATDLRPFTRLIREYIDSVMLAHVCYPAVCPDPAGFSRYWIQDVLRKRLGFDGTVISDDLGMRAAEQAGSFGNRMLASLRAGCDLVMVCRPDDVRTAFNEGPLPDWDTAGHSLARAAGQPRWDSFCDSAERRDLVESLRALEEFAREPG